MHYTIHFLPLFNSILLGGMAFLPPLVFFLINLFRKMVFISNQLDVESNLFTNTGNSWIIEVAKVMGAVFPEVTFRNFNIFSQYLA